MNERKLDKRVMEYHVSYEKLSPVAREKWLNKKLQSTIQYAYKNAPAVKEKLDRSGIPPADIRTIKDTEKIPVTTKDQLVKLQRANPPFGGLLAVPLNSLNRVYVSPGPHL